VISSIIDFFYPRICPGCKIALVKGENCICSKCLFQLPRTNFLADKENVVAKIFWGRIYIENAASFLYFQKGGRLQEILHHLKYRKLGQIGVELGQLFGKELIQSHFAEANVIVPVPLHPSRLRKRGYNQSEKIGQGISETMGIPMITNAIKRVQKNESQTHKSRYDRWENVEQIFKISDTFTLTGKHVLLVDDVITTGATIEACAHEILKTPNCKVSIVTIAYAMK
jgi:ComF family protein